MIDERTRRSVTTLTLMLLVVGCSNAPEGHRGTAGGACYPNATCNAGLVCLDDLCIHETALDGAGGATGSAGRTGTGGAGTGGGAGGTGGPSTAGQGQVGAACAADRDCAQDLRCLQPLAGGKGGYCARTCSGKDACSDLEATSYDIQVPATFTAPNGTTVANGWGTEYLGRGSACAPAGGQTGQPTYCQFVCPAFSAVMLDASGQFSGCGCLPGFRANATDDGCEVNPDVQCTIFTDFSADARKALVKYGIGQHETPCTPCNSDMSLGDTANCHTNRFGCEVTSPSLNGKCAEFVTVDEILSCAQSSIYTQCNCQCASTDACYLDDCACCTCTHPNQPPPRPVCNSAGGAGGGGGVSGTGKGGTSGGTGSAGTSGGGSGKGGGSGTGTGSAGTAGGSAGKSGSTTGAAGGSGTGTGSGGAAATGSGSAGHVGGSGTAGGSGTGTAGGSGTGNSGGHA
jgi:hypothetical protein